MKKLVLVRLQTFNDRILGRLHVYNGNAEIAQFVTLELPWLNNKNHVSCIPTGTYTVEPRVSDKFGHHLWVKDVPGRDLILFHNGCFPENTHGCILLGMRLGDIDKDGKLDTTSSKAALELLVQFVTDTAKLTVINI